MKDVGSNIRYLRKELRMTQEELAGKKFTKSYISLIERGKINPSMKALSHIAENLNKPVAYLLDTSTNIVNDKFQSDVVTKIDEGHVLAEKGELRMALLIFNDLLEEYDTYSNYYQGIIEYYLGFLKFKLDNSSIAYDHLKTAIRKLQTAIKNINDISVESMINIYIKLGECYYLLNDTNKSLNYSLLANEKIGSCDFNPDREFYVLKNIIYIYIQRANFSIAIDYLNKLIELSKKNNLINKDVLESYISLATCYFNLEQYEKAEDTLNKIIPVYEHLFNDPKSLACIYYKLAELYLKRELVQIAANYISKSNECAEEIIEDDDRIYNMIVNQLLQGRLLLQNDELESANELAFKIHGDVLDINRNNPEFARLQGDIKCLIGEIAIEREELDQAHHYLESGVKIYNNINANYRLPNAYKLLGSLALKMNNSIVAQKYYNMAFKNYSKNY